MNSQKNNNFYTYHRQRIAVVLHGPNRTTKFQGIARFETDDLLGNVLRVRCHEGPASDNLDLVISETEWNGEIREDEQYGCEYCFVLGSP